MELFPDKKGVNKSKLKLAPNSKYSITPPKDAKIINNILNKFITGDYSILDGTGNVGGDIINFGLNPRVKKITGIEVNKDTFEKLKYNVKKYGLDNKVDLIRGDSVGIICNCLVIADVLYLDAPWGGRDYKKIKEYNLKMGNHFLYEVVKSALKCSNYKLIVLKVPFNQRIQSFLEISKITNLHIYKIPTHKRFYSLIVIQVSI